MKIKSNKINYSPFLHENQVFNKCEINENKFEWLNIIETEGNGIIQKVYVDSFIKKVSIRKRFRFRSGYIIKYKSFISPIHIAY